MALLWIDGFDAYGDTVGTSYLSRFLKRYPDSTTTHAYVRAGRFDGYAVSVYSTGYYLRTQPLNFDGSTIIIGLAIRRLGAVLSEPIWAIGGGTYTCLTLQHDSTTDELKLYRGNHTTGTLLGTTTGASIGTDWRYIEVKVYISDTVGTLDIYVDGVSVLSLSDVDTQYGAIAADHVRLYSGSTLYQDDLYIADGSGSDNNDILGPQKVVTIFPAGDSSVTWTPSTGSTHYDLLDEVSVGASEETDWVETDSAGTIDVFDYGDITDVNAIAGIQLSTVARNYDGSTLDLVTRVVSGATTSDSSDVTLTSDRLEYTRIIEVNPDTSSSWTISSVNAATFGIKSN